MGPVILKRTILQRIFGICATQQPKDEGCWTVYGKRVEVDLARAPELSAPFGAIRMEGKKLPVRLLLVRGDGDRFHTFQNQCRHMGRRLDPVPGTRTVQCCSIGKSTYDFTGQVMSGSAKKDIATFETTRNGERVIIQL